MRYDIPAAPHRAELTIERSRFICTIAPVRTVDEAQAFVRAIDAEFADATHNCWAYAVGAPGSTDRIGMSDDGEPHGTAGRPMLTVLLHSGVGDVAAVVTRYYGGTKLGTGGLVKAYGGAVQEALLGMRRVPRVDYAYAVIVVAYGDIGALRQLWDAHEVETLEETFAADVTVRLRVPEERYEGMERAVLDATRGLALVERVASGSGG